MTDSRRRFVFLTGAGASHGAGGILPVAPPLGAELYELLRTAFPVTWGLVSGDFETAFREDFESGMEGFWASQTELMQRALVDVGVYFSRFRPPSDGSDLYSQLLVALSKMGVIDLCAFGTLNYECVLDLAVLAQQRVVTYGLPVSPGEVLILKLHGACNAVSPLNIFGGASLHNLGGMYKGPVKILHPSEVEPWFAEGRSMPPAMSLFAPGKVSPVAEGWVGAAREHWSKVVADADVVTMIGARPLLADEHVWAPMIESEAEVWYVGGTEGRDLAAFANELGPRFSPLGRRFHEAIGSLTARIALIA